MDATSETLTKELEKINVILALKNNDLCQKSDVSVDFNLKYARLQSSRIQEDLDKYISESWQSKCQTNSRLYNASKFRLASFQMEKDLGIHIEVGITSYKDLLGTHHYPNAEELLNESYDNCFKGEPGFRDEFAFMSNCLGVGAITLTKDDQVILMERAKWTGEAPGKVDRPGGHPEPDLLLKEPTSKKEIDFGVYEHLQNEQVLDEIFKSPQNELRDEINIPLDFQEQPKLLGLIRDMDLGGRCAFDFLIQVDLDRIQIEKLYKSGHQVEADESTELIFLPKDHVKSWTIPESLACRLTHHALGGLRLYHLYLNV